MKDLQRALRKRRRVLTVLVVGAVFTLSLRFYVFCVDSGTCPESPEALLSLFSLLGIMFSAFVLAVGVFLFFQARRRNERYRTLGGFPYRPWEYDRQNICLTAEVVRVFQPRLRSIVHRKLRDLWRRAVNDYDPSGRYVHQRFLVTSPLLKPGCKLMVIHNTEYGWLKLRKGSWVRIQGQYIHQRGRVWGWFGSRLSFYGRVHRTHEPHGFIEILRGKPALTDRDRVQVVELSGR